MGGGEAAREVVQDEMRSARSRDAEQSFGFDVGSLSSGGLVIPSRVPHPPSGDRAARSRPVSAQLGWRVPLRQLHLDVPLSCGTSGVGFPRPPGRFSQAREMSCS